MRVCLCPLIAPTWCPIPDGPRAHAPTCSRAHVFTRPPTSARAHTPVASGRALRRHPTQLARLRRRATATAASANDGVHAAKEEGDQREAQLRGQLEAAERRLEEQAKAAAHALSDAGRREHEAVALVSSLRKEVGALSNGLRLAQAASAKADAAATKAKGENARLTDQVRELEVQIGQLRARLAGSARLARSRPSAGGKVGGRRPLQPAASAAPAQGQAAHPSVPSRQAPPPSHHGGTGIGSSTPRGGGRH